MAKNHHFVCLPLALVAVHKCCHFLVGGSQNVIKCEGRGGVSQKVTNCSKKESYQQSLEMTGSSINDVISEGLFFIREMFLVICPWH